MKSLPASSSHLRRNNALLPVQHGKVSSDANYIVQGIKKSGNCPIADFSTPLASKKRGALAPNNQKVLVTKPQSDRNLPPAVTFLFC